MAKITVIGSMIMDNVVTVERFPEPGETVIASGVNVFPGGKGMNQCITVARLGGDVEMIGMLGKDDNGKVFADIMDKDGVKRDNVFFSDVPTGSTQIQVRADGQNRICVIPSANYEFGDTEVEKIKDVIKNTEYVLLQLELRIPVVEKIISLAASYGKTIILNPAPAARLSDTVLAEIDFLTPNETELSLLTVMPVNTLAEIETAAKSLIAKGVKNVIVTVGDKGAVFVNATEAKTVSGYKIKAVDTVAAGDSFNGAFVTEIANGKSIDEALAFANAVGAVTVSSKGAIPSIKYRKDIEAFIENYGKKKIKSKPRF